MGGSSKKIRRPSIQDDNFQDSDSSPQPSTSGTGVCQIHWLQESKFLLQLQYIYVYFLVCADVHQHGQPLIQSGSGEALPSPSTSASGVLCLQIL